MDAEDKVKRKYAFSIVNPHRVYFLNCESAPEMQEWLVVLRADIERLTHRIKINFHDLR